ncbi:hypothetical protein [Kribbella deserti]|uniref:ABC transporter permease n=1 Tax=Kribbella deserti TaxID=1926257 RepID=A0ABV6QY86_9ACTN
MTESTRLETRQPDEEGKRTPPVAAVVTLLTVVLTVLLIAFAWPASRSEPRDLPIALAAPAPVAAQITGALNGAMPGAFEVKTAADRNAAFEAIKDREVYGAIVVGEKGPEVLTASAASPAVAQILSQLATKLSQQQPGAAVTVTDVVPVPADDPRGAGLAAGALPLVLGGILAAAGLTKLVPAGRRRIVGALAFSVTGALALTAVLQYWLGSLGGNYWANSSIIALSVAAVSITLLGLEWLLGTAGLGLGAATMMLLGNPLSGLSSAPEMLPTGWGAFGQFLPPGAAGTALRSVSFFDGAGAGRSLIVLAAWLAFGLALVAIAAARTRRTAITAAPTTTAAVTA